MTTTGAPVWSSCQHIGPHHSLDMVTVFHGRRSPTMLCGFHASMGLDMSDPHIVREVSA